MLLSEIIPPSSPTVTKIRSLCLYLLCCPLRTLHFYSNFEFTAKLRKKYRDSPYAPYPRHSYPPLLWTSPPECTCLPLMTLCWHIIVTQSTQFTLQFTLDVVCSAPLNKFIVTCIHHYNTIQSIFMPLKVLRALPVHPCLPSSLSNHWSFFETISIVLFFLECLRFLSHTSDKESTCQYRIHKRCRFMPRFGTSLGEGNGNWLHYFLPRKPHGQRSLVGYSP